jgi:diguanylate cyclase (GGDEF)-like protein
VVLPFDERGERSGFLLVAHTTPVRTHTDEVETLELLATHAGLCLETARLLDDWRTKAVTDPLTGLGNHAAFRSTLDSWRADGLEMALLIGDVDGFKAVNDELGHRSGDEVLVTVARRIEASVRITDTASRFGGDEFLVLCEGFEAVTELETVAQRIIEAVARPVEVAGRSMTVGMSLGIALAGEHTSSSTLLAQADDAMYEAKARGKGTYQVAPR